MRLPSNVRKFYERQTPKNRIEFKAIRLWCERSVLGEMRKDLNATPGKTASVPKQVLLVAVIGAVAAIVLVLALVFGW